MHILTVEVFHILKQVSYFFPERHNAIDKVVEIVFADVGVCGVVEVRVVRLVVEVAVVGQLLHFVLDDALV